MTYEEFLRFVPSQCMYDAIYQDQEGRNMLVLTLLDAYSMVNKVVAAEREACAKLCEAQEDEGGVWDIQQQCANAIRARGQE